jgi:hypothetical protein
VKTKSPGSVRGGEVRAFLCWKVPRLQLLQQVSKQKNLGISNPVIFYGPRQYSHSWSRAASGPMTDFLFFSRPFLCLEMGVSSFWGGGDGLSE